MTFTGERDPLDLFSIDEKHHCITKVLLFALKGDGLNFIPQADDLGLLKETTVAFLGLSEADLGVFGGKGQNMFVVVPFVATSDMPSIKGFVDKAKEQAGADAAVSNYVMTHYADRHKGGAGKGWLGGQRGDDRCPRRHGD
jgi:hypothetical protein